MNPTKTASLRRMAATGLLVAVFACCATSSADVSASPTGKVFILMSTNYEDSLPYEAPLPTAGWVGIRSPAGNRTSPCELVNNLELRYVRDEARAMVNVQVLNSAHAPGLLIHGYPLSAGPVACATSHGPSEPHRTPDFSFARKTIFVTIESHHEWTDVVYHQGNASQVLLHVPASAQAVVTPDTVDVVLLADLDRDGKPDLWLEVTDGGEVFQDFLFMSGGARKGALLREVARTDL